MAALTKSFTAKKNQLKTENHESNMTNMKNFHFLLTLCLIAVTALVASVHGWAPAALTLFVGGHALTKREWIPRGVSFITLTPAILLTQTLRKIFVKTPALSFFSHEFTAERVKLNQSVTGKIRTRPTASTYDADNGGYKAGAQESRDLLVDVPFVMDNHIHVTVKLSHLNALQDSIIKMEEHVEDSASVIGASVGRYVLGKVRSSAFSHSSVYSEANSDKDALNDIRKDMNLLGVGEPRFGLVNSAVAESIGGDARVTNRADLQSKDVDTSAYSTFRGLSGFDTIQEDPALGDGSSTAIAFTAEADDDVITTASAHGYLANDRVYLPALVGGTGLTAENYYYVKTVPSPTTLTVSATRGGTVINITADATAGSTIQRRENLTGFFATREAIAIKTALPTDGVEIAQALGIPVPVSAEVITDPDTGLSMIAYKWFEQGVMDAYITLACLYGATAGELADTGKHVMEPSGHMLVSA